MEVVASLSQGRTAAAQCGLFTYKSVPVIFEPPCIKKRVECCALFELGKGKMQVVNSSLLLLDINYTTLHHTPED